MGLNGNNIGTWEEMKEVFYKMQQYYYKDKDRKEEIFNMTQKEHESLEDYV